MSKDNPIDQDWPLNPEKVFSAVKRDNARDKDFNDLEHLDMCWLPLTTRDPRDVLEGRVFDYFIVRRNGVRMKVMADD